ncbi:hypothetical protein EIP86_009245 [Pleurotus ostreatoroseus]|nr:hypothetical protein EIP86_009245 [Pleurotus ostreatoroseus]
MSDWDAEPVHSSNRPGNDVYNGKTSSNLDFSTLKLDVERVQFKWNVRTSCYEPMSEGGGEENGTPDDKPRYTPTCAFAIAKVLKPAQRPPLMEMKKSVHAWSPHFLKGARAVLEDYSNVAWGVKPLQVPTRLFIMITPTNYLLLQLDAEEMLKFLPSFDAHIRLLEATNATDEDTPSVIAQLRFFTALLRKEHASKLKTLTDLLTENQITFELVPIAFTPGTVLLTHCSLTGEPLMVRLKSCIHQLNSCGRFWALDCWNVDVDEQGLPGRGLHRIAVHDFAGAQRITDLAAFPVEPYLEEPRRSELRQALVKRGRRFWELANNWCHTEYDAVAWYARDHRKIAITSRIMLDREKFRDYAPTDGTPFAKQDLDGKTLQRTALSSKETMRKVELTEEEYMLMPAKLFGFGLADREWLVFNVGHVKDIEWNTQAFEHLDIHEDKKDIVKTLILSHTQKASQFDDFVQGPPGVGKTLTAEATSEVARAPLYMVGAGDLGTDASDLDSALHRVLTLASAWKAVVLIDEADVFLEKRDLHDLQRNAMVAVFLRQLEYYTGILILTTNRLSTIDGAMKSRIHVSLHYGPLTAGVRSRLWAAFLQKAGLQDGVDEADTQLMKELCQRNLNGREIKNVIKTATTYAAYHGRAVHIKDVLRVISVTDDMAEVPPIQ